MFILAIIVSLLNSIAAFTLSAGQLIQPLPFTSVSPIQKSKSLFDLPLVEQFAERHNLKQAHVKTLYSQLLRSGANGCGTSALPTTDSSVLLDQLLQNGFPKTAAAHLLSQFPIATSTLQSVHPSTSGGAKLVIKLANGLSIETVLIKHISSSSKTRYTVCVSSQVGCARACSFCASGTMGLLGNLSSGEILEQLYHARLYLMERGIPLSSLKNVVFMGMGEPLDNFNAVVESLRGMSHQTLFGLAPSKITVSTVGGSPGMIRRLAECAPQVNLALSLHGGTQELREKLIPSAKGTTMEELGDALNFFNLKNGRGVMLEYLLIQNVNDEPSHAKSLADFAKDSYVNLIPYSEASEAGGGG